MDRLPEFVRSVIASMVANALLYVLGVVGALMMALITVLTRGLLWWQASAISALFGLTLLMLGALAYKSRRVHAHKQMAPVPDDGDDGHRSPPKLKIHSAYYGAGYLNDIDIADTLNRMIPMDGLAIMVNNSLIPPGIPDPAPMVPKALKLYYSFAGPESIPMVTPENELLVLPRDFEYERQQGIAYEEKRLNEVATLKRIMRNA